MGLVIDKRLGWLFHNHDSANDSRYLLLDASNGPITGPLVIDGFSAVQVALTNRAAVSQTANIVENQLSDATLVSGFDARGILFSHGGTNVGNTFIGDNAGKVGASGTQNVAIGQNALDKLTSGDNNFALGRNSLTDLTIGLGNVAVGTSSLGDVIGGDYNVSIGYVSGRRINSGNRNVFIGPWSGNFQTTVSSTLLVDERQRASAAEELTNSILYGVMSATPAAQTLRINAAIFTPERTTPTPVSNYGAIYPKADNNLYFQDGAGTEKTLLDSEDTMAIPINISMFDAVPSRASESNWNGALLELDNAAAVNSGAPFVMSTKGSGKVLIVVNAGGDLVGDITLTGTAIDRNTGVQTGGATSVITINGTTTDGTTTDANGNTVHAFTKAYISDKWFTGIVTITTADTAITDMDVYHVSFEQVNDSPNLTLDSFDANIFTTNVGAEFDAYLFVLDVTGDECDVTMESELHVGAVGGAMAQTAQTNKYFRLRKGNIARALDGATDGLWADVHYVNSPVYVEDVTLKIWLTKTQSMTIV